MKPRQHFDAPLFRPPVAEGFSPLPARASDPETSKAAARRVCRDGTAGAQREEVLAAVLSHPGRTSRELAGHCRLDRYQIARRLPELERAGLVERGGVREGDGDSGVLWWPAGERMH